MKSNTALLGALELKREDEPPLHRQLADGLRDKILTGRIRPGARLPSTRGLSLELGVSRNTVISAYDQLVSEGFLQGRSGDGTRVMEINPDRILRPGRRPALGQSIPSRHGLSAEGNKLAAGQRQIAPSSNPAFTTGLPAVDQFPHALWARVVGKVIRSAPVHDMGYNPPGGHPPLKELIAKHLMATRGVQCTAEQVLIVSGGQAALDFTTRMLLDPGDHAWIEDPGYLGARSAIQASGAHLLPVGIDHEGLDLSAARQHEPPKLIFVTPSYQYPLGITMSLDRRLALLRFAYERDTWVLEDDYDSDFRYHGRILSALQGLDNSGRVIYMGTFSKTMFPALRLAYLVVPHRLIAPFSNALRHTGQEAPMIMQAALTEFIHRGHYRSHLRRMHKLYEQRQRTFLHLARTYLDDYLRIDDRPAGMQLVAFYRDQKERPLIEAMGADENISLNSLSTYYLGKCKQPGLFLGYAGVPESIMRDEIKKLCRILQRYPV